MANNLTTQTSALATLSTATILATYQLGGSSAQVGLAFDGGQATTPYVAGAGDLIVKASKGILHRVLVTVAGTAPFLIYDHASTPGAGATIIGVIPANAPAGAVYTFHMPAVLGIVVDGVANTPGVTISWS